MWTTLKSRRQICFVFSTSILRLCANVAIFAPTFPKVYSKIQKAINTDVTLIWYAGWILWHQIQAVAINTDVTLICYAGWILWHQIQAVAINTDVALTLVCRLDIVTSNSGCYFLLPLNFPKFTLEWFRKMKNVKLDS